jgi:O-acetyl-ADP-ribose deacetylase
MQDPEVINRIEVLLGDITQQKVDTIVNAANHSLLGGGGVDGAIHRAAGPELLEECRKLHGCATGSAKQTPGYRLAAKWVIHTVGPVWRGGGHDEDRLLADCYYNCLELACKSQAVSIAFPSISTGAYGFPVERAARIAVSAITQSLKNHSLPAKVIIVCFDTHTYDVYSKALRICG